MSTSTATQTLVQALTRPVRAAACLAATGRVRASTRELRSTCGSLG
jgi:hypothetical protein